MVAMRERSSQDHSFSGQKAGIFESNAEVLRNICRFGGGHLCFWAVMGVFERANVQMLKLGKAKKRVFWTEIGFDWVWFA
jgi:hypothetical protein